jgi:hypothetical protein
MFPSPLEGFHIPSQSTPPPCTAVVEPTGIGRPLLARTARRSVGNGSACEPPTYSFLYPVYRTGQWEAPL